MVVYVTGGALFAEEFAREFYHAQEVNASLLEGGAKEEEHDRLGMMKSRNGSKVSVSCLNSSFYFARNEQHEEGSQSAKKN